MISFIPDNNNIGVISQYGEGAVLYTALDGDNRAECVFTVEGSSLRFFSLKADRLTPLAEGLIRSALAYGAARNAYTAEVPLGIAGEDFKRLGFTKKNNVLYAEIPDVLLNCK